MDNNQDNSKDQSNIVINNPSANASKNEVVYNSSEEKSNPAEFVSDVVSLKRILSFFVGIIVFAVVLLVVIKVLLPNFQKASPGKITLTYWGLWEDSNVMDQVLQDFENEHPNIKVNYEKQDVKSTGKYIDRLVTRIGNDTGPDVFRYHNSWVNQLKPILFPMPLDAVSSTELQTKYYDVINRDMNSQGAYFGIPLDIDTLAMFVNTDILKAAGIDTPPTTWDEMQKVSRQLTVKDDHGRIRTAGVALGTYDNIDHASDILSLLFVQNGANLYDLGGPTKKNAVDALDYYTSFVTSNDSVWSTAMENSKLAFAKGKVAIIFGYSWDLLDVKALNPKLPVNVYLVPHLPGKYTTIASYWAEGVSAKSKHPQEAFELIKFLSRKETLSKLYTLESKQRLFGELYPRTDMADLLKYNDLVYPFLVMAKDSVSTPFSSTTYDDSMNSDLNQYLAAAVNSIVSYHSFSVASAIDTLASGANQVFSRFQAK